MERLLTLAVEWATSRVQFGERIYDFQGVSLPAGRLGRGCVGRATAHPGDRLAGGQGADPKVVHAKASLAKLFASEAAFRCADRVVQVFGGRGYMREYAAERFFRELRVDRIWEGTARSSGSIIARALEKRGVGRVVGRADDRRPASRSTPRHRPAGAVRPAFGGRRRRVARAPTSPRPSATTCA